MIKELVKECDLKYKSSLSVTKPQTYFNNKKTNNTINTLNNNNKRIEYCYHDNKFFYELQVTFDQFFFLLSFLCKKKQMIRNEFSRGR